MKVSNLIQHWEQHAGGGLTEASYSVRLPLEDAAKLAALHEMFPKKRTEELITDLLHAALNELEGGLPYVPGSRIISEDEQGDPLYEDEGQTPRLLALSQKHLRRLKAEQMKSEETAEAS
ncbi:hypothetical protein [Marinimicrobium sp. ABcell2]|uniref:hypothetical protein n=1 Tax=Marinimicrobium sp. ABcell2 TaxID=3069751 RepID=UPI0027B1C8C3|nr:hypothetical protein [Marinimicrobium sp. ABcell2]MDQ2077168.1 hypothetical protein [Marinimicrobium sp. ABcell2]